MRERMTPACLEDLSRHLRHLIPPSPFHMHAGEKEPQGTMKRRRKSSSPSSGSSTKFRQKSFPILMGDALKPATLLRMPEEDMPLPPHDVPIFFYKEEVIIRDDEGSDSEGMKAVGRGLVKPGQARKRRFRPRPTFRWVLEALDIKLHGNTNKIQAKDGSAYFILRVDESTRETRLVPLVETVMLRQTAPDDRGDEERSQSRRRAAEEYIEHGNRFEQRAEAWAKRYGRRLVDVLGVEEEEGEEEGHGGARARRMGRGGRRAWQRTHRVDEDVEAGEMDHNPSTKVGTSYQDVFALMEGEEGAGGGRRRGEREALAVAFETVDTGEVPDAAEEGFGAPEYGDEYCQPEHLVAAREAEEEEGAELLEEEESSFEGGRSSESEEEAWMKGGRRGQGGESKRWVSRGQGTADFEKEFADVMERGPGEEEEEDEEEDEDEDEEEEEEREEEKEGCEWEGKRDAAMAEDRESEKEYLGDDDDSRSGEDVEERGRRRK